MSRSQCTGSLGIVCPTVPPTPHHTKGTTTKTEREERCLPGMKPCLPRTEGREGEAFPAQNVCLHVPGLTHRKERAGSLMEGEEGECPSHVCCHHHTHLPELFPHVCRPCENEKMRQRAFFLQRNQILLQSSFLFQVLPACLRQWQREEKKTERDDTWRSCVVVSVPLPVPPFSMPVSFSSSSIPMFPLFSKQCPNPNPPCPNCPCPSCSLL